MKRLIIKGKKTISIEAIIVILILIVPFVNIGSFYGYPSKLYYCFFLTLLLFLFTTLAALRTIKLSKAAGALLLFLSFSMIMKNFPTSLEYFIVILCGVSILHLRYSIDTQIMILKIVSVMGLIYALSLYWHWLSPNSFYVVLKKIVGEGLYLQAANAPLVGDYTGFACESNRAGLCVAPGASVYFARAISNNKKRVKSILLFLLTYGALILTGRRAFILFYPAIFVSVGIYILLKRRSAFSKIIGLFTIIIIAGFVYFYLLEKIIMILTNGSSSGLALSNREVYWELALNMFYKSPIIGNGMRSYDYYYNLMSHRNLVFAGAHNCYLQMLAEIGILGTGLFILLVAIMIIKTVRSLVFSLRNDFKIETVLAVSSLMMQLMFIFLSISESAFIAPYSAVLYFFIASVGNNSYLNNVEVNSI